MRRARIFFNSLSAASLLICLAAVALWIASSFRHVGVEFPWRGARWEAAYRWGSLSLNNGPQRRAEEEEHEATRRAFVYGLGWGTAPHRRAMEKLHQWEAHPGARATPVIDHRLPQLPLTAGLLLLPAIWLAVHPVQRRRVVRHAATAAMLFSSLCFVGTAFMWARSYRATDVLTLAPYRLYRAVSGRGGVYLECLRVEHVERTVEFTDIRQYPLPSRSQITPLSEYARSPLDIAQSEYAEGKRAAKGQARRWNAGSWEWQGFPPGVRLWALGKVWTQPAKAGLPRIAQVSSSLNERIIGSGSVRREIQEEFTGPVIWLPYWLLLLLSSPVPLLWLRRHAASRRRKKRSKLNLCLTCGYDLRGTPGRCPECGTVTAILERDLPQRLSSRQMREAGKRPPQTAFSLAEMLVVMAIIVVLLGLLVPVLGGALKIARASACQSNLRQWGNAWQMYLSNNRGRTIPEQTNEETTLLWWEALAPYHGNIPAGLLCPEAASPLDTSSRPSARGAATYAWRRQTFAAPRPQRVIRGDWVGSYGFNVWVYAPANAGDMQRHYIHFPAAEATRIPLIGDCCGPYTVCLSGDSVPLNLQGAEEENVSPAGLPAYCIDRHRMAVNIVFLDGHVERVPLAGLRKLKWSETFAPRDVVVPRKS